MKRKVELQETKSKKMKESKWESYPLIDLKNEEKFEIPENATKFQIDASNLLKAFAGEIKFASENPKLKKKLFGDDKFPLFLQINCVKLFKSNPKILRLPLKHSLLTQESEICLIVPDVKGLKNKDHDKHLEHYENFLNSKSVKNIKKIMTFHEFRTEFETFELKNRLVELYDVFLVDGRISGKVVKKCGKIFYKKRKVPIPIKMQASKLKNHIESSLMKSPLHLHGNGDSFVVEFGHSKMSDNQLVENVYTILDNLDKQFPGGCKNIRNINIFTYRGISIPIYTTLKNQNNVKVIEIKPKQPKCYKVAKGPLSTRLDAEVIVNPEGEIVIEKNFHNKKFQQKIKE